MSRRRRSEQRSVARAQASWEKVLRRRARASRGARAATAATAAAVTLAGAGTAFAAPGARTAAEAAGLSTTVSAECPTPRQPSSYPNEIAAVGDTVFFSANDGVHGRELWKTDGTEAGTVLVKNINPNDATKRPSSSPRSLTEIDGQLFFRATDGTRGHELWKSDGTRTGTVLVKDIQPAGSGYPSELTAVGSRFFFTADDGTHGEELWKSDGTRTGTVLVKNIAPWWAENYYGSPHYLTASGNRVFFAANDGPHGVELWKSNGTRTGTVLVKDVDPIERNDDPDYPGGMPSQLTALGGRVFFTAHHETRGEELWRSDGSRLGTVLVKDIDSRERFGSAPFHLTRLGDRLFFSADDGVHGEELWRSDGTRAGTLLLKDIDPGLSRSSSSPSSLTAAGDQLFFAADDGSSGESLWKSDGSRAGTLFVKNFNLSGYDYPPPLIGAQGRVFFPADDGTPGQGLWTSDGTTGGTVLIKDFASCDDSYYASESSPSSMTVVGDLLYFAGEDAAHGEELWMSNGTTEGTVLVKDIRPGTTP